MILGPEVAKRNKLGWHGTSCASLKHRKGVGELGTDCPPRNETQGTSVTCTCLRSAVRAE